MNAAWYWQALSIATALACGLLIGIERGWKLKEQKPDSRVAGVRTFSMLGLGSGIAGLIGALGQPIVAAALAVGAVAATGAVAAVDAGRSLAETDELAAGPARGRDQARRRRDHRRA